MLVPVTEPGKRAILMGKKKWLCYRNSKLDVTIGHAKGEGLSPLRTTDTQFQASVATDFKSQ